jgi:hypothetical protein
MMRSVLHDLDGRGGTLAGIMADGCCKSKCGAAQMMMVLQIL